MSQLKPSAQAPLALAARRRLLTFDGALLLGLACGPALAAQPATGATVLRAVTLTVPLFGMADQQGTTGIFADVVKELARQSGIAISNSMAPKIRGQAMLGAGLSDLLVGFDSAELQTAAVHVGPVATFDVGIIARAGLPMRTLEDLRGKTVGQLRGARYSKALDADARIFKHEANTLSQLLRMLELGRVDAVAGVREALYWGMDDEGIARRRYPSFLALGPLQAWLHYSRKTYDAALADRLEQALARMRKSGQIAAIVRHYVERTTER